MHVNGMLDDYLAIENGEEDSNLALQRQINNGTIWRMQGSMGRTAMRAIEAGLCMLGRTGTSDYYGNPIPSRDDVQPGTKGSREYVAERMGEDYANMMMEAA